jgi:hypothetical protein
MGLHANDFQNLASAFSTTTTQRGMSGAMRLDERTRGGDMALSGQLHKSKVAFRAGVMFERFAEPPDRAMFTRDSFYAMLCVLHATDLASPRTLLQSAFYAGEEFRKAAKQAPDYGLTSVEFEVLTNFI